MGIGHIPEECARGLGRTHGERINTMIADIVKCSTGLPIVRMSPDAEALTERLRQFMFENVYLGSSAKSEEGKAENLIRMLYHYFMENPDTMGPDARQRAEVDGVRQAVIDYIAGMTDRYAVKLFRDIYLPRGWEKY